MQKYIEQIISSGESISALRENIANEMVIMQVQQGSVMRGIHVSEQELNNFLNSEDGKLMTSPEVKLGQILISIPSTASTAEINACKKNWMISSLKLIRG